MSVFHSQRRERCNFLGQFSVMRSSASRSIPVPESMWAESAQSSCKNTFDGYWSLSSTMIGTADSTSLSMEKLTHEARPLQLTVAAHDKQQGGRFSLGPRTCPGLVIVKNSSRAPLTNKAKHSGSQVRDGLPRTPVAYLILLVLIMSM